MAMQVGSAGGEDALMIEMNMTPLIDVMLVLMIMFIITIPIQTHAVKMNMPIAEQRAAQGAATDRCASTSISTAPSAGTAWR